MEEKQQNKGKNLLAIVILSLSILISSFMIALTNRYEAYGSGFILDTWTKTIYIQDGSKIGELGE